MRPGVTCISNAGEIMSTTRSKPSLRHLQRRLKWRWKKIRWRITCPLRKGFCSISRRDAECAAEFLSAIPAALRGIFIYKFSPLSMPFLPSVKFDINRRVATHGIHNVRLSFPDFWVHHSMIQTIKNSQIKESCYFIQHNEIWSYRISIISCWNQPLNSKITILLPQSFNFIRNGTRLKWVSTF